MVFLKKYLTCNRHILILLLIYTLCSYLLLGCIFYDENVICKAVFFCGYMFLMASNACTNRNWTLLKWCVESQSLKAGFLLYDPVWMTGEADFLSNQFFWKNIYFSELFREKHILFIPMIQGKTVLFLKNSGKNIPKKVYEPCLIRGIKML